MLNEEWRMENGKGELGAGTDSKRIGGRTIRFASRPLPARPAGEGDSVAITASARAKTPATLRGR